MPRTSKDLVAGILGENYDSSTSLKPYISMANNIVSQAISLAAQNSRGTIIDGGPDTTAELMERWLAAYYYTKMDPIYLSKSDGASGSFVRGGETLDNEKNDYKRGAIEADWTGTLNALLNRKVASAAWLGKTPSEQIPYSQRN